MTMATTLVTSARRVLRAAVPCVLAVAGVACGCPPLVDSYSSPESTLATWQSRLCRDDLVGEYDCLAAGFKNRIGHFPNYHAARAALLDESPAATWLFERADLQEHIVRTEYSADGLAARLELEALGERVAVEFALEAWLTLTWADGTRETLRQELPLVRLLGSRAGQQWLTIQRPTLPPDRLADVRSVAVESRWKIADISGLAVPPAAGTANTARSSRSHPGCLP